MKFRHVANAAVTDAVNSCTELPLLICEGFFQLYFSKDWPCPVSGTVVGDRARQKVKYTALCCLRMLSKEFRCHSNKRIMSEFGCVVDMLKEYATILSALRRPASPLTAEQLWSPLPAEQLFSDQRLAREVEGGRLKGAVLERLLLSFGSTLSHSIMASVPTKQYIVHLKVGVANFMAMAGYKCFWCNCLNAKSCNKYRGESVETLFQCVYAYNSPMPLQTVFGCKECMNELAFHKTSLRHPDTQESKLAQAMMRIKDKFQPYGQTPCEFTAFGPEYPRVVLVRHSEHVLLPSLERALGLTADEMARCKAEIQAQGEREKKHEAAVRKLYAEMRVAELNDWLSSRQLTVKSVNALKLYMPATAGYLIECANRYTHHHIWSNPSVVQILKDLILLLENVVLLAVRSGSCTVQHSHLAADFMTGKLAGLFGQTSLPWCIDRWPISRAFENDPYWRISDLVDAFKLFARFTELELSAVGKNGKSIHTRIFRLRDRHGSVQVEVPVMSVSNGKLLCLWMRNKNEGLPSLKISEPSACLEKCITSNFDNEQAAAADRFVSEAAGALLAHPATRGLGLEVLGVGPTGLVTIARHLARGRAR